MTFGFSIPFSFQKTVLEAGNQGGCLDLGDGQENFGLFAVNILVTKIAIFLERSGALISILAPQAAPKGGAPVNNL